MKCLLLLNMKTVSFMLFLIACFLVCLAARIRRQENGKEKPWDFLILAQFWPGTSCLFFVQTGCVVPPDVKGWTIHGLWPSVYQGKEQPQCCNESMTFNYHEIKNLRHQLNNQWPYFNRTGSRTVLWKHEWDKHGTCAHTLPILHGELKYFSAALKLHSKLDFYGVLRNASIIPKVNIQYNLTSIFNAIMSVYNKKPLIVCLNKNEIYYLDQIYQCYSKTLGLIDCPEASVHNLWTSVIRRDCLEKQRLSLFYAKEKHKSNINQKLDVGDYFISCPDDQNVLYIPVPRI